MTTSDVDKQTPPARGQAAPPANTANAAPAPAGIRTVASIADLRMAPGNAGTVIVALGYAAAGDGGGGMFFWSKVPLKDDGGTVVNATIDMLLPTPPIPSTSTLGGSGPGQPLMTPIRCSALLTLLRAGRSSSRQVATARPSP